MAKAVNKQAAAEHRMRWYVYSGGQKLRHQATMRGHWPGGYDVECKCGWKSRTGGAVRNYVEFLVWEHKWTHGVYGD